MDWELPTDSHQSAWTSINLSRIDTRSIAIMYPFSAGLKDRDCSELILPEESGLKRSITYVLDAQRYRCSRLNSFPLIVKHTYSNDMCKGIDRRMLVDQWMPREVLKGIHEE